MATVRIQLNDKGRFFDTEVDTALGKRLPVRCAFRDRYCSPDCAACQLRTNVECHANGQDDYFIVGSLEV